MVQECTFTSMGSPPLSPYRISLTSALQVSIHKTARGPFNSLMRAPNVQTVQPG